MPCFLNIDSIKGNHFFALTKKMTEELFHDLFLKNSFSKLSFISKSFNGTFSPAKDRLLGIFKPKILKLELE